MIACALLVALSLQGSIWLASKIFCAGAHAPKSPKAAAKMDYTAMLRYMPNPSLLPICQ